MKYLEIVKLLANNAGIDIKDVIWILHDNDGIENITEFEVFWDGYVDGKSMKVSKIIKESDYPELFEAFLKQ